MVDARPSALGVTRFRRWEFVWGARTYIMGIINMTPDSFSGDGLGYNVDAAVAQASRFVEEGVDILDVGGQSTRPPIAARVEAQVSGGVRAAAARPVDEEEELRRVIPVVERLARDLPVPISIDTFRSAVARRAIEAGAAMVNDVWGLKHDPAIARVAAKAGAPLILMHNQRGTEYRDLAPEVIAGLRASMDAALRAGVPREHIIVDPGFGFGKTREHNLELLRRLRELTVLGRPILVGTSRKSTIGAVLDLPVEQRIEGTAATVAIAIANGADIVRVHDVRYMARVARMADAVVRVHA
ncbi:MAG: dihydropteroate synthase [Dehalococcoidia bacterium]|nr:dihydropteroate synthase [Dehalococcoidia bacterium]